ncbi:imidazole glycerol phosphate synthase subunit HisF [Salinarimonas sp. NSM]|uniref:imidazole glycerol phosphate synthase subunit HisF n=1 Tax=Salinarimonas sp. NSM TaxID=3458003 RepID=UPI004036B56B
MLKIRLIPVLLLQNGLLVRSETFSVHQVIGNPYYEVKRFNEWNVDELVYLDITRDDRYDIGRDDHKTKDMGGPLAILEAVSKTCFMPLTWGGRIRSTEDMRAVFNAGADKVAINSQAFREPELITRGAAIFGNQAMVVSIDARREEDGRHQVYVDGGRTATGVEATEWARKAEAHGAGEILLQSLDRDGTGRGYDLDLVRAVAEATTIPVIACSGVGRFEQYKHGVEAGAAAVAAANIWHFKELADRQGKRALARAGVNVRL